MGILRTLFLFGIVIICSSAIIPLNGLIVWYKLNEGSGLVCYNSKTKNNTLPGTLTNGAYYMQTTKGQALYVDGTNDYVSIADNDIFSFGNGTTDRPFSISLWLNNQNTSGAGCRILGKTLTLLGAFTQEEWLVTTRPTTGYYSIICYNNLAFTGSIAINSTVSASTDVNKWIHLVFTYNGNSTDAGLKIYRNGIQLSTTSAGTAGYVAMNNGTAPVSIGVISPNSSPSYGKGNVNNIMIYNRELSATEAMNIYQAQYNLLNR